MSESYVISCCDEGKICLWNTSNFRLERILQSEGEIKSMMFVKENDHYLNKIFCCYHSGNRKKDLTIWDPFTSKSRMKRIKISKLKPEVAFEVEKSAKDGDNSYSVFITKTPYEIKKDVLIDGYQIIEQNKDFFITCSYYKPFEVNVWRFNGCSIVHKFIHDDGEKVRDKLAHRNSVFSLCKISEHGFASGSVQEINIYCTKKMQIIRKIKCHRNDIYSLIRVKESNSFISGSWDSTMICWNLKNYEKRFQEKFSDHSYRGLAILKGINNKSILHVGYNGKRFESFSYNGKKKNEHGINIRKTGGVTFAKAFLIDKREKLIVGFSSGCVKVYEVKLDKKNCIFKENYSTTPQRYQHSSRINCIDVISYVHKTSLQKKIYKKTIKRIYTDLIFHVKVE